MLALGKAPQEEQQLIREIYQQLSKRSDYACNFLETPADGKWGKVRDLDETLPS